jgi:hypothetical protein
VAQLFTPVTLNKPTQLTLVERELLWEDVDGASGYVVEIKGVEYQTQDNAYLFSDGAYGLVSVRVKATNGEVESGYLCNFRRIVLRVKSVK